MDEQQKLKAILHVIEVYKEKAKALGWKDPSEWYQQMYQQMSLYQMQGLGSAYAGNASAQAVYQQAHNQYQSQVNAQINHQQNAAMGSGIGSAYPIIPFFF